VIAQMSEDYYYFAGCSRGAGAEPLPEREVSSQKIFLLVAHGVQGQSPCRSARCPRKNPFFFHFVPPQAAQNEN
jgi:hypothetical protein